MGACDSSVHSRFARRLAAVFVLALLLRAGYLAAHRFALPPDTDSYAAIASNLASGNGFSLVPGVPTAYRPPAYPVFLSIFEMLPGGLLVALLAQCVIASGVSVTAGLLARRLAGDAAGLASAAIVALDPYQIAASNWLMTEALFSLLVIASVALLLRASGNVLYSAAAGLVSSLAFLTRPEFAFFFPVGMAVLLVGRSRRALCAAAFLLCFALLPVAWTARNAISLGRPISTTTHGGYTHRLAYNYVFYERAVSGSRDAWSSGDESFRSWAARVASETEAMNEVARDIHNSRMASSFMASDLSRSARIAVHGAASFWRPWPHDVGAFAAVALGAFSVLLAVLAVTGLVLLRTGGWFVPLVLGIFAAETAVHMYYWSNVRMRVPFQPLLAVAAGCAIAALYSRRRRSAPGGGS